MATTTKIFKVQVEGKNQFVDLDSYIKNADESGKSLKTQLREINQVLGQLDETSDEFLKASQKAGQLKDQIGDINQRVNALASDTFKLDGFIGVAEGITAGFGVATSAMNLFGVENDSLNVAVKKTTDLILLLNSLQSIQNLLQTQSTANLFLSNSLMTINNSLKITDNIQTAINNGLKSQNIIVTNLATIAQRALNLAMSANPMAILITLVGALTVAYAIFADETDDSAKSQVKLNDAISANIKLNEMRRKGVNDTLVLDERIKLAQAELLGDERKIIESKIELTKALIAVQVEEQKLNKEIEDKSIPASKRYFEAINAKKTAQEEELKLLKELKDLEASLNQDRETSVNKIESLGLKTIQSAEKVKKEIQGNFKTGLDEAIQDGYEREIKFLDAQIDLRLESFNQAIQLANQITNVFIDAQQQRLDTEIEGFENQKELIDEQIAYIDTKAKESADKQQGIEDQLRNARGLRREALLRDLGLEKTAQEKAEKDRQKLEDSKLKKDEEIAKKRREQEKLSAQSALLQSASQTALAVASIGAQSAKQDFTFGIATVASIGAVLASLTSAITQAKALAKFEDGGIVEGASHSQGGVKALVGGKNMIELEGGEAIINKRSTAQFKSILSSINQAGGGIKFENGGVTDLSNISTPSNSVNELALLRADIIALSNRPVFTSITDINSANGRINRINDITSI